MRRQPALDLLSPVHASVYTLAEQGLDDTEIAAQLGLEAAAVGPLLHIARAKLEAVNKMILAAEKSDDGAAERKREAASPAE